MIPFTTSDLSKRETNLFTSSGCNGGTRIGPVAPGGGLAVLGSGAAGVVSTEIPSNRGNGPAIVDTVISKGATVRASKLLTLQR